MYKSVPPPTFVLPPRSALRRIVVPAPIGMAGDAGVYVPEANRKSVFMERDGGLIDNVNSVAILVKVIVEPDGGVGILLY